MVDTAAVHQGGAARAVDALVAALAAAVFLAALSGNPFAAPAAPAAASGKPPVAAAAARKERLALVDNARFCCVALVIFSHCADWLGVQGDASLWHPPLGGQARFWPRASADLTWPQMLYNHYSLWFMPAITFLSGLGSQAELTSARAERMLIYVVGPACLVYWTGLYDQSPVNPTGHMWYLSALVLWRLAAVLLRPLPRPHMLAVGALVTCFAPRLFAADARVWGAPADTNPFALKLAVNYFFFFVLGLVTSMDHLRRLSSVPRLRAVCAAATVLAPCLFASDAVASAAEAHVADLYEFQQQPALADLYPRASQWAPRATALVAVCALGSAAVLALPAARQWYTAAGGMTMYPYVLHVMVIAPMSNLAWFPATTRADTLENAALWIPGLLLLPLALCYALTTRLVRLVFWPVLEPTWLLLLLRPSSASLATLAPRHLGLATTADWCKWAALEAAVASAAWAASRCGDPQAWPHGIVAFLVLAVAEGRCGALARVFTGAAKLEAAAKRVLPV